MMSWPQAPTLSLALNADAEQQQQQWTNRVTSCCGAPHEVCKLGIERCRRDRGTIER